MALLAAPATLTFASKDSFVLPAMLQGIIKQAAANAQHLYEHYVPQLVSLSPTVAETTADTEIEIGVEPSADGLKYSFRFNVMRDAVSADTIRVTIYEWIGGAWSSIDFSDSASGTGIATWTKTGIVVQAGSTALKFKFHVQAGPGTHYRVHHILGWPSPTVTTGIKASGFRPWHTGLYGEDYIPIDTEHVGRPRRNAFSLLADRKPMVFSFAQINTGLASWRYTGTPAGFFTLGRVRIYLPNATGAQTLAWHCTADVGAGATADLVQIVQAPSTGKIPTAIKFAADGSPHTTTQTVYVEGSNAGAHVDVDVIVKHTAGQITTLRSLCAFWRPANLASATWPVAGINPTPPASLAILLEAVRGVERVALGPYAPCVHVCDGISTGVSTRYFSTLYGPGAVGGGVDWYRHWDASGNAPPAHKLNLAASGVYSQTDTAPPIPVGILTFAGASASDRASAAPVIAGGSGDHMIALVKAAAAQVPVDGEVQQCAGFTVWTQTTTADPTTL